MVRWHIQERWTPEGAGRPRLETDDMNINPAEDGGKYGIFHGDIQLSGNSSRTQAHTRKEFRITNNPEFMETSLIYLVLFACVGM